MYEADDNEDTIERYKVVIMSSFGYDILNSYLAQHESVDAAPLEETLIKLILESLRSQEHMREDPVEILRELASYPISQLPEGQEALGDLIGRARKYELGLSQIFSKH